MEDWLTLSITLLKFFPGFLIIAAIVHSYKKRGKKIPQIEPNCDQKEINLEMKFVRGESIRIDNPLGTLYDNAEIYINGSKEALLSSPFLELWSASHEEFYTSQEGIWLSATDETLFLEFEKGSRENLLIENNSYLFYPVPEKQKNTHENRVLLIVTCMN